MQSIEYQKSLKNLKKLATAGAYIGNVKLDKIGDTVIGFKVKIIFQSRDEYKRLKPQLLYFPYSNPSDYTYGQQYIVRAIVPHTDSQ